MSNWFESLSDAFKERLTNPFIGAFVFAWGLWNFDRLYLLVMSSLPAEKKLIEFTKSSPCFWSWGAVAPLLFALIYVCVMPWIAFGIHWLQEAPNQKQKLLKIKTEESVALAQIRVEELRKKLRASQAERLDELKGEIASGLNSLMTEWESKARDWSNQTTNSKEERELGTKTEEAIADAVKRLNELYPTFGIQLDPSLGSVTSQDMEIRKGQQNQSYGRLRVAIRRLSGIS